LEYNLVHAFLGRFGVLIPLLGLFFELGGIVSQKPLVSKIAGGIVILGSIVVIMAGMTGYLELSYLRSINQDIESFETHILAGITLVFSFTLVLLLRILLYRYNNDRFIVAYFILYVLSVVGNIVSNEMVIYAIRGG